MRHLEFDLMENQILVLSIENHLAYRNILEELWKQYKGETGNFILSDGDKELKMSQRIECIYNIFNINTNDRKINSLRLPGLRALLIQKDVKQIQAASLGIMV